MIQQAYKYVSSSLWPCLAFFELKITNTLKSASKAHWFAQVLFQDTDDDRRGLTIFEDAIHQTAKLTSDTDQVKGLTQADIESIGLLQQLVT